MFRRLLYLVRLLTLFLLAVQSAKAQKEPFFANRDTSDPLISRIRIADYQGPGKDVHPDVDANEIIAPLMSPFVDMFDMMQQNAKIRAYADKVEREREESPLSSSKSIFDILEKLQRPTTTTTPQPPLLERLLQPYIEPWQKQLDYFSKDMTGFTILPSTTTTTTPAPTTRKQSILEKSLAVFFPSLRHTTTTTRAPPTTREPLKLFDPELLERLLFSRNKRSAEEESTREKRQVLSPLAVITPPPAFPSWEKPILEAANPFTPNPLMAMFTMKPLPEIKLPDERKAELIHNPATLPLMQPQFKLQDPFYNPLYPNRKSKLFDLLAGGDAARLLG